MRAVNRSRHSVGDRGVTIIWVAGIFVVLLGMGALAIDVSALYQERRELQNGADAAALAVARDCADPAGDCAAYGVTAKHFANANAEDDVSAVAEVCGGQQSGALPPLSYCKPDSVPDGASGWVSVTTSTETSDGGTQVRYVLAPVLNAANVGGTMLATAVAAWGPIGSANTIPLTLSACEFEAAGGSLDPTVVPSGERYIYFHTNEPAQEVAENCEILSAGKDAPGGFGWLDGGDNCEATVAAGGVSNDPGNSFQAACADVLRDAVDNETAMVIPIYFADEDLGQGNFDYPIVGFAGFKITGFRLGGNPAANYPGHPFSCPEGSGQSARCIRGEFTNAVVGGSNTFDPGNDFGAVIVRMVG